jgi:glutathione S-transferase
MLGFIEEHLEKTKVNHEITYLGGEKPSIADFIFFAWLMTYHS